MLIRRQLNGYAKCCGPLNVFSLWGKASVWNSVNNRLNLFFLLILFYLGFCSFVSIRLAVFKGQRRWGAAHKTRGKIRSVLTACSFLVSSSSQVIVMMMMTGHKFIFSKLKLWTSGRSTWTCHLKLGMWKVPDLIPIKFNIN